MWRQAYARTALGWPQQQAANAEDSSRSTQRTLWLEGLRGISILLVLVYRFGQVLFTPLYYDAPYGADLAIINGIQVNASSTDVFRLPLFRVLLHAGRGQGCVVAVLAGFSISLHPLQKLERNDRDGFYWTLASSAFRRWFRLYFPCFGITFILAILAHFRFLDMGITRHDTFLKQLWDWLQASEEFAYPLAINRSPFHNYPAVHRYSHDLWIIPFLYAASLLLYLVLLAFARYSASARLLGTAVVLLYAAFSTQWHCASVLAGSFIAMIYVRLDGRRPAAIIVEVLGCAMFIASLLLASIPPPSSFYSRPGYSTLDFLTPESWMKVDNGARFWWTISAILLVGSASVCTVVQHMLASSFAVYMGRHSFMLYLTHRITLYSIGDPIKLFICRLFGKKVFIDELTSHHPVVRLFEIAMMYVLALICTFPAVMAVARLAEACIQHPSQRITTGLERQIRSRDSTTSAYEELAMKDEEARPRSDS